MKSLRFVLAATVLGARDPHVLLTHGLARTKRSRRRPGRRPHFHPSGVAGQGHGVTNWGILNRVPNSTPDFKELWNVSEACAVAASQGFPE